MIIDYDNFFLPAEGLEAGRRFYGEVLGLQVKFDFSERGLLAFGMAGVEPAIILKDVSRFAAAKPSVVFRVADVRRSVEILKARGVVFIKEPYRILTGWAAEFTDPSGNVLGITDYNNTTSHARNAV